MCEVSIGGLMAADSMADTSCLEIQNLEIPSADMEAVVLLNAQGK